MTQLLTIWVDEDDLVYDEKPCDIPPDELIEYVSKNTVDTLLDRIKLLEDENRDLQLQIKELET